MVKLQTPEKFIKLFLVKRISEHPEVIGLDKELAIALIKEYVSAVRAPLVEALKLGIENCDKLSGIDFSNPVQAQMEVTRFMGDQIARYKAALEEAKSDAQLREQETQG